MSRPVLVLFLLGAVTLLPQSVVLAQSEGEATGAEALSSSGRTVRVHLQPSYQSYENAPYSITEWSLPVRVTVPLLDRWQLRVQGSVARVEREAGEDIRGLTDVQAALSYTREIGESSVIVSTNLNLPTGTQEFTPDEFKTTTLLSQNIYDFPVSGFGQGFGVSTGATWALPVNDRFALGLGGSYQVQGSYTPVANMSASYEPGNQILMTGGLEYRITRTSALSVNGSLTLYGADAVGGTERFDAGSKGTAELQFVREWGYNALRITAQYEGRGQSTRPVAAGGVLNQQVFSDQALLRGYFETRLSDAVDVAVSAAGHSFGETVAHESETIAVVGVRSTVDLGGGLSVTPRVSYTTGTFTGVAGGLAVGWRQ